jgi:hypothetical protein
VFYFSLWLHSPHDVQASGATNDEVLVAVLFFHRRAAL